MSKKVLLSFPMINALSMATSLTSSASNIQFQDDIGIQFTYSGSPVGTVSIEVSADYAQDFNGNVQVAGNWAPLTLTYWDGAAFVTGTTIPLTVGSPIYVDLALLSAPWIRSKYTRSSGTGTLTATITGKEV